MEEELDPIYGEPILPENKFIIGKISYDINSLLDWFLTKKCFINPYTNTIIKNDDLKNMISLLKTLHLAPNINYDKIPLHKTISILERHKQYSTYITKNLEKINKLEETLKKKRLTIERSLKRKNGQKTINNTNIIIDKIMKQISKFKEFNEMFEKKYQEILDPYKTT